MKSIKTPNHPLIIEVHFDPYRSVSSRTVQFWVILRTEAIYVYLFIYGFKALNTGLFDVPYRLVFTKHIITKHIKTKPIKSKHI